MEKEVKNKIVTLEYIDWIENYTETHKYFSSEDGLFSTQNSIDKENIKKLQNFYEAVSKYASENYIMPEAKPNLTYFKLEYNGINYSLGCAKRFETSYFCNRTDFENKNNIIDLEYIINGKKQPITTIIDSKMNILTVLLEELKLAGVEEDFINNEVVKVYVKKK